MLLENMHTAKPQTNISMYKIGKISIASKSNSRNSSELGNERMLSIMQPIRRNKKYTSFQSKQSGEFSEVFEMPKVNNVVKQLKKKSRGNRVLRRSKAKSFFNF